MRQLSQKQKLYNLLKDGREHTTLEILEKVYGVGHAGIARIASRINDLRNEGNIIDGRKDQNNPSVFIYRLRNAPAASPRIVFEERNGVMTAVLKSAR